MATNRYSETKYQTPFPEASGSSPKYQPTTFKDSEYHGLLDMPTIPHRDTMMSTVSSRSAYNMPFTGLSTIQRYTSPVYVIPVAVVFVHAFLLIFSWAFFASIIQRPRALSIPLAIAAEKRIQSVTLVVTLISSFISFGAAVLYRKAIRYSLTRFLAGRMTLYTLSASIRMSQSSVIKNFKRPLWTIGAILAIIAVNSQTAGYTTLFTPKKVEIVSPMTGFELDLRSPAFQALMEANQRRFSSNLFEKVLPLTESTGSTAVSTRFSLPSIFNFNQFSYFNSTKGILPTTILQMNSSVQSASSNSLPVNVKIHRTQLTPPGFPVRFTMTQQGFSASVTCRQQELNNGTSPSMAIVSANDELFGSTATLAAIQVGCPGSTQLSLSPPVLTSNAIDAVFALQCPATENGRKRWDLIIAGSGKYSKLQTSVCSIFPEIHTLQVDYSDDAKLFSSPFPNLVNSTEPWDRMDAPWIGEFSLGVFLRGLEVDQSTTGNAMGDTVLSFVNSLPSEPDLLSKILAEYVRAVLEFSVTVLRTIYTEDNNNLYPGGTSTIPDNMRVATNGTFYATTIGWSLEPETAPAVLLAPTIVSVAALAVILFTLLSRNKEGHGKQEPLSNYHFNATDILHVISAASAGALNTAFPPFHEENAAFSESVVVTLAPVDGGRPGFINYDSKL
ncbi:hypothetical protein CVT24_012015 [Panaeolus cyanescens]|uniref:Uncharacterized protein n=1 Tax=Panaeolus cyanescens TaxID=181874 RepID=A0A409YNC0_9AGAR|nr:hypothetical protein CVT24_012015 [Panaeolus cyanescens]